MSAIKSDSGVMIGWTTVGSKDDAEALSRGLVDGNLAACVQISGPISSFYSWKGVLENCEEYRLAVKFDSKNYDSLLSYLNSNHPYEVPQWLAIQVDRVDPAYAKWVLGPN